MRNPEASSSRVSVASATLPAYNPPGIPPRLGSFKLSAAERLDDLRPGLEYIQQYLTENGWALEEFLIRAQNLWILWQEEVERAQGMTLSARYGLGGHFRASTLRRDVSQLIKTMRDRGTKKALEKSAQDLKRAQKSKEKSENSARPQKAEPLKEIPEDSTVDHTIQTHAGPSAAAVSPSAPPSLPEEWVFITPGQECHQPLPPEEFTQLDDNALERMKNLVHVAQGRS